jgi:hypothetical protein
MLLASCLVGTRGAAGSSATNGRVAGGVTLTVLPYPLFCSSTSGKSRALAMRLIAAGLSVVVYITTPGVRSAAPTA